MTRRVFELVLLLVFPIFLDVVYAKPLPYPKSAWFRKSRLLRNHATVTNDIGKRDANVTTCQIDPGAKAITAPKFNVWQGLTDIEIANVTEWLFAQADLNLTKADDAGEWDNTVLLVDLMPPNKTDAVSYFDEGGPQPTRYAHVTIDHRADVNPYYGEILVGPLPVDNSTCTWQPLTYPYTKDSGGQIRNLDADADITLYEDWYFKIGKQMLDITLDLWNGSVLGLDNDTLDIFGVDPVWQYDGVIRWDQFWNFPTDFFDAETLLPLGLFFKSNVTGRDPSKWTVDGWLYNDIFYKTTDDFRKAYYSPGFQKLGANVEGAWATTDQQGTKMAFDEQYPPTLVQPTGTRFSVDVAQKFISWMDFTFYLSFNRDTGMRLYDITYKGKRIIYELGLQEALAHYAGNDPVSSGTSYLDSYYGFGPYSFELVKGYDCPTYATYLNSSFYTAETTHTHIDAICLFEMDPGYPLQHHTSSQYVAVTKNIVFTVRNICTVGNYDYMFSYSFTMDGSIHVEVRASGYIQATYWAANGDYGYHIHDSLSGSMHDHVLNFKIDFDVLGTNNTMQMTENIPVSESYVWSDGMKRNTMKLNRTFVTSEDNSKLNWAANSATQFIVVNQDEKNKYGEFRGYRVLPSEGTVHLTVQNSSNLVNAANWVTNDIFVTKQKDTEPRSAYPYNGQDVYAPMIDFNKFFDGENLNQTDIVVWVNLGMHHIPHTGDLPNTVFTTAHSGIQILPLNYLLGDPSRETVNMVRINYDNGTVQKVDTFGQTEAGALETCQIALNLTQEQELLHSYQGDIAVRKFPYDPNNPFYDTQSIVKRGDEEIE